MKDQRFHLGLRDPEAPLTASMDNVHAWCLGEACNAAAKEPAGDLIDRGLILLRELNEQGFDVVLRLPESEG